MRLNSKYFIALFIVLTYILDLFAINYFAYLIMPKGFFTFYYFLFISLSWSIIALNLSFYVSQRFIKLETIVLKLLKQFAVFTLLAYAYSGIYKQYVNSFLTLKYTVCAFLCIALIKVIILYVKRIFRSKLNIDVRNVIVIGQEKSIEELRLFFTTNSGYGFRLVKVVQPDENYELQIFENHLFIEANHVEEIYCSLNDLSDEQLKFYIDYCENNLKTIKFIASEKELMIADYKIDYYGHIPIASFANIPFNDIIIKFLKRIFDLVFASFILITVLSWLFPIVAAIVKFTSKGPIFYLQERIGENQKPFKIIKFRSMKIDAEAAGPKLSSDNDDRITSIGRILRKYRIDEFPQFFNVLKGDMSIVGPRPERAFFINEILKVNPRYKRLHNVKPGITSLGQVYYGYAENIDEMNKRLQYDLLYLKNFNFLTDIKIIFLTVAIVFKGKGK